MVICPDCGKDVKEAKFCSNCGASLKDVNEVVDVIEEEIVEDAPVEEPVEVPADEVVEDAPVEEPVEVPADEIVEDVAADEADDEDVDVKVKEEIPEEVIEPNTVKKSKFCANCGKEVDPDAAFCPACGFKFGSDEEPQTKFCQTCGKKININAEICPYCGVRVAGMAASEEKSVLLAAILSFLFPGLGHLYNGLTKKGVSFIIAYIVSAILVFILIGFVLMIIVWIWALIDSIKTTESINRGEFVEDKLF